MNNTPRSHSLWTFLSATLFVFIVSSTPVLAHCDSMDGPVITEARAALESGEITPILKWVKADAEPEIRAAFEHALKVRALGPEAKELADTYFFETLIRVHRAGEGAPFTGLKPAGQQEPVIVAADQALESGSAEELIESVTVAVKEGIEHRFHTAYETKQHSGHNVPAGREFVEAYVDYVHFVERLHNDAVTTGAHHAEGSEHSQHQH